MSSTYRHQIKNACGYAQAAASKVDVRLSAAGCGICEPRTTKSYKIVKWRSTVDEDGHYCFAVAL
jgi:hypothetical protein